MRSDGTFDTKDLAAELPPAWRTEGLLEALGGIDLRTLGGGWIPGPSLVFRALSFFPPGETKVVILGQDPYPDPGKANGLAFGVAADYAPARADSFAGIEAELGRPVDRTLEAWARQGVLLLNAVLSTAPGAALAHGRLGWGPVVGAILNQVPERSVYLALGAKAAAAAERRRPRHLVAVGHPSPLGRINAGRLTPFVGSGCFPSVNELLEQEGVERIAW